MLILPITISLPDATVAETIANQKKIENCKIGPSVSSTAHAEAQVELASEKLSEGSQKAFREVIFSFRNAFIPSMVGVLETGG